VPSKISQVFVALRSRARDVVCFGNDDCDDDNDDNSDDDDDDDDERADILNTQCAVPGVGEGEF